MAEEFDRFARSYDRLLEEAMPEAFAEDEYFARYKVELMARKLGPGVASVLDFGCGTGRSLRFLGEAFPGAAIAGFDASAECAQIARQSAPGATVFTEWSAVPVGAFDAILAANVFHHVEPPERRLWLQRCGEALSPVGRLFLFEHNPLNPVTRRVFERCAFDVDATMIPRPEALRLTQEAGLRVVDKGYSLFFPRPLALLRPAERLLRWLPLGAQYYVQMAK